MSIAAYTTAVRNHLRSNLTNFYSNSTEKARNCKVMIDEQPTADCGQEFISIYGSIHQPKNRNLMQAIEETFGLIVCVSRKIAFIPPDYRGELGYLSRTLPDLADETDATRFYASWAAVENRCREIVGLVAGTARYSLMQAANTLINSTGRHVELGDDENLTIGGPITEPLLWLGTDPSPRQVGPEHFFSSYQPGQDVDPIIALVMKVYFGDAVRMQPVPDYDYIDTYEDP